MSRISSDTLGGPVSFPRVSGDEPESLQDLRACLEFSPRERG